MSMSVGCFWSSFVIVWRSGSPSGVSVSFASSVSPSWYRKSAQSVRNCCWPLVTPFPPYSSPAITTIEASLGWEVFPSISLISGSPPFFTA